MPWPHGGLGASQGDAAGVGAPFNSDPGRGPSEVAVAVGGTLSGRHRAGVKRLLGLVLDLPALLPPAHEEAVALSGPPEADQPAYAIAKIAGIECVGPTTASTGRAIRPSCAPTSMVRGTTTTWTDGSRPAGCSTAHTARASLRCETHQAKDTLYSCLGPCSYRGAIRAPLCGLAYRRLSFGPVACKLGARIKSNLDVELCCPFSWSAH